ncbi:heterogeneous nuclear ribonucleoprotein A1-like isoform X2 [Neocloeon triangulifer]|nr:heterogeneous nuclear ribonucleoprotein A1-like isoform X2 [Neocloeon triangulifer]
MAAAPNQGQQGYRKSPRDQRQNAPISPEAIEEAACKLFIASLPASTNEENLRDYFSKFGQVTEASIARDPGTKESRRFGFITFANKENVDAAQAARPHQMESKQITTKRSIPKGLQQSPDIASTTKTLYVGGLKDDAVTEDSIKDYFKQFGNIEKIYWSINKETNTKRPYCFVYFDDSDAVDKIVFSTKHELNGLTLNTKKSLRDVENGPQKRMMPHYGAYPQGAMPPYYGQAYDNMMPGGGRGGYMYPAPMGRGGHYPNMHFYGNGYGHQGGGNSYGGPGSGQVGGGGGGYRKYPNKGQQQQRPVAKA